MRQRSPLTILTPLPPSPSGIADYAVEQLPSLAKYFAPHVLVQEQAQVDHTQIEGVTVSKFDPAAFQVTEFDHPILYHIGNNIFHEFVFRAALKKPGYVVLHDFVLHHLVVELTLARNDPKAYRDYLIDEYGEMGRSLADQRENYAFTSLQEFLLPLNGKILDAAKGVIVHSHWAKQQIETLRPQLPVLHVPHHFYADDIPYLSASRAEARRKLGIAPDVLVFLCIGHITPPKQVELVAKTLGRLRCQLPPFLFLLVGEASDEPALQRTLKQAGIADCTRLTGRVHLKTFQEAMIASDVVCNLRYPSAGESSGTLIRAMGFGRCCVVFDYASFSDYSSEICVKVPLNTFDAAPLAEALLELARDPERRNRIGDAARRWARSECSVAKCVQAGAEFIVNQEAALVAE
jgi:glycosyltransferase involved in cell wall biosynthesis